MIDRLPGGRLRLWVAEKIGIPIAAVGELEQWEFEVWRYEYRRLNEIAHRDRERAAVAALLAKNRNRNRR